MSDASETPPPASSPQESDRNESPESGGPIDWRGAGVFGLLLVGLAGLAHCVMTWCGWPGDGAMGLIASALAFGTIVFVGFRR